MKEGDLVDVLNNKLKRFSVQNNYITDENRQITPNLCKY